MISLIKMRDRIILSTDKREELVDITQEVDEKVKKAGIKEGICNLFVKHASAAITINENYDPNLCDDFLNLLRDKIPQGKWKHDRVDGNGDAHLKSAIIGPSISVPISNGQIELGRWQSIMFCEFDGPRSNREILLTLISD
jgi:secondary thiamine-phosphate synthase enzyme